MFYARGYTRIIEHPGYLLFGAGEGAYHRFLPKYEFHSSLGTVLFCYGLPGTIAFTAMLWAIIRRRLLPGAILLMPALVYGLAHQGLRFTMFWVMLACIAVAIHLKSQHKEENIII
ncbi:MAG: hypothetical protein U5P41_08920 [Gammaproteobacteria bacterium]|nr:hypothetical protein [Gammaproteobacteria bacterium]